MLKTSLLRLLLFIWCQEQTNAQNETSEFTFALICSKAAEMLKNETSEATFVHTWCHGATTAQNDPSETL